MVSSKYQGEAQAARAYNAKLAKCRPLKGFVLGICPFFKNPRIVLLLANYFEISKIEVEYRNLI